MRAPLPAVSRRPGSLRAASAVSALLALGSALAGCGGPSGASAADANGPAVGRWDWPAFGHDPERTFAGRTTLTAAGVRTLRQAWFFRTGDVVSATPAVVDGTVYAGSWDDWFYAVNFETGRLRWKYHLSAQDAVTPYPGQTPRDITSDGGLVTSSAWFQPADGTRPALVIFGGGYTLYALVATTGALYWRHDYTGFPDRPPSPDTDGTRIMSSPVVADGRVLVGVDSDGLKGGRGYVVAASLDTGDPVWEFQTDTNSSGVIQNDGCGSVWSSGSLLPDRGLVVFSVADCKFSNPPPLQETVIALRIDTGGLAWTFRPSRADNLCDLDFGATANVGLDRAGHSVFLGVGGKDGTYYSIDPATGRQRWATNVVFGGFSGGFIASSAYDGTRVVGATAKGDFGRFERGGQVLCDPGNPRDKPVQEPSDHAFVARTGAVAWQASNAASFAATTLAGGMGFNDLALSGPVMEVRDAATGKLLSKVALEQESWSGIATVGDAVVVGEGTDYDWRPSGIEVLTPDGRPPVVPSG